MPVFDKRLAFGVILCDIAAIVFLFKCVNTLTVVGSMILFLISDWFEYESKHIHTSL